jgi:hypothetical protein
MKNLSVDSTFINRLTRLRKNLGQQSIEAMLVTTLNLRYCAALPAMPAFLPSHPLHREGVDARFTEQALVRPTSAQVVEAPRPDGSRGCRIVAATGADRLRGQSHDRGRV